jgi:hypothetical protein
LLAVAVFLISIPGGELVGNNQGYCQVTGEDPRSKEKGIEYWVRTYHGVFARGASFFDENR